MAPCSPFFQVYVVRTEESVDDMLNIMLTWSKQHLRVESRVHPRRNSFPLLLGVQNNVQPDVDRSAHVSAPSQSPRNKVLAWWHRTTESG